MEADAFALVERWHRLLNEGAIDDLMALIHPEVRVGGPRGTTQGAQVFRQWFSRAGIKLLPLRYFRRGDAVVVVENATWGAQDDSQPAHVWTAFTVADGLITGIARFDGLAAALEHAGLREEDAVA